MYHRGHPADYDDWVEAGATGWTWEENLKYFDMTEGNKQIGELVSAKYHSDTGPLPVQNVSSLTANSGILCLALVTQIQRQCKYDKAFLNLKFQS